MSSEVVPLRELADLKSGGTPSKSRDDYWNGDIPWISGKTLHHTFVNDSDLRVSEAGLSAGSNLAPIYSSLILVRGMSLLQEIRIGMATRPVAFNQDVKAVVARPTVSPRYLNLALRAAAPVLLDQVHQAGHGTGVLATDRLTNLPIWLPSMEEQERITGVLGAFDDLIDTNRRLIESLDQTATHRANQLAKDASGDWLKFADVADIGGGGTPSTKTDAFWDGVHPWATPKDITALPSRYIFDTPRKLTDAGLVKCSSPLRPVGSILMTSRATVGEFALAKVPLAVNQGFIVVNGESPADTTWLYFEMRRRIPEFKTIAAKGSTFPEISRREFRSLDVHWPEPRLRQQLHREVAPLLDGAAELEREVASLTAQRDELLPLLMSGQVRVRDVEAAVS